MHCSCRKVSQSPDVQSASQLSLNEMNMALLSALTSAGLSTNSVFPSLTSDTANSLSPGTIESSLNELNLGSMFSHCRPILDESSPASTGSTDPLTDVDLTFLRSSSTLPHSSPIDEAEICSALFRKQSFCNLGCGSLLTSFHIYTDSEWPKDLPHPLTLQHAVDVFFRQGRELSAILNEDQFRKQLALPATHPCFPNVSLLHAILAASTTLVSYDLFRGEVYFLPSTARDFHTQQARETLMSELIAVRNVAQVSQSLMIICYVLYWQGECVHFVTFDRVLSSRSARSFVQHWLHIGLTVRCVGPLGLNNLKSPWMNQSFQRQELRPKVAEEQVFYINPVTLEDHHEAAWVYWRIFVEDRSAALQVNWPLAINEGRLFQLRYTKPPWLTHARLPR